VRRTLLSALAIVTLLGVSSASLAQAPSTGGTKPIVVVSFSGLDELRADIEFVGKLADNPTLADGLDASLTGMTQGKGLAGLDPKRPWGLVIETDGQTFPLYGFLPVTDLGQLLDVLGGVGVVAKEAADGIFEIATPAPVPVVVKQKGDWALIANKAATLANTPADPSTALAGLNKKYDLAVRLSVQNIPPMFRQMAIELLKSGADNFTQPMPGESDEQFAIRKRLATESLGPAIAMINDLDTLLLGIAVDRKAGTSYLDVEITAVEGTDTAKDLAAMDQTKTNFAGFLIPEAAVSANWTGKLSKSDIMQLKISLDVVRKRVAEELGNQGLSEAEAKRANELFASALDVVVETIESGQVDGGGALLLEADSLTALAGGVVADGAKVENVLKQLAKLAQDDDPNLVAALNLKLDAQELEGVSFHTLSIPIPTDDADAAKLADLVGEHLDVVLGIGPKSVYLAAGRDATEKLKQVISKSKAQAGKEVPPMQVSLALASIAKFAAKVADEEVKPVAAMIAAALAEAGGKDHVRLTSTPIPGGVRSRLELEQGVLKVLGMAGQMAVGGGTRGGSADANRPPLAQVSGTVTLDGKALAGAAVSFEPGAAGAILKGRTDPKGRYELSSGPRGEAKGAAPGLYTVRIKTKPQRGKEADFTPLPAVYNEQSALRAQTTAGMNTLDFNLSSK